MDIHLRYIVTRYAKMIYRADKITKSVIPFSHFCSRTCSIIIRQLYKNPCNSKFSSPIVRPSLLPCIRQFESNMPIQWKTEKKHCISTPAPYRIIIKCYIQDSYAIRMRKKKVILCLLVVENLRMHCASRSATL